MNKTIFAGWWQVAISMLNQAAAPGTIVICYSVIAAPLAREFGANRGTLGLVMTLVYAMNGLLNPLLGKSVAMYFTKRRPAGSEATLGYSVASF